MRRMALLVALFTIFGCGEPKMRPLSSVELARGDLSVANTSQMTFQRASGLQVAPLGSYAALTAENGALSVVTTLNSGCYLLVGTTRVPLAQIDVGATNLNGEAVNNTLERNDWYQTAGMAVRGFCLAELQMVTLGAVTEVPRMAVLLSLYPARDSNALVRAVSTLQNNERTAMHQTLVSIARVVDAQATLMPWAASLPSVMRARSIAVSMLPAGAAPGACLLIAVTGSGGDVDLYVFTGEPPLTSDRMLASDQRVNPNAAVVFTVPQDPGTVRVGVQSFAGGGAVEYAAYTVRREVCAAGTPVPIPNSGAVSP